MIVGMCSLVNHSLLSEADFYRWRELPQVLFLSRQKIILVAVPANDKFH